MFGYNVPHWIDEVLSFSEGTSMTMSNVPLESTVCVVLAVWSKAYIAVDSDKKLINRIVKANLGFFRLLHLKTSEKKG
jgi:hypothetical protein